MGSSRRNAKGNREAEEAEEVKEVEEEEEEVTQGG